MGVIKKFEGTLFKKALDGVLAKLKKLEHFIEGDLVERIETVEQELAALKTKGEKQMAQIDELETKLAAVQTGIDDLGTELTTAVTDAAKTFADLKAKIAALPGSTPTDLTAALASADTALAKVTAATKALADFDASATAADAS